MNRLYTVIELRDEDPVGQGVIYPEVAKGIAVDAAVDRVMESFDSELDGDEDRYRSQVQEQIEETGQYELGNWRIIVLNCHMAS
jgi:hypothetical protein